MADIVLYKRLLGMNIQRLRKERCMSQEQLAEAIGASRVHMGYIEQGKRNPSLKLLLRIAEAFDVPMSKLFDFVWAEDDAKSPPVEYDSH